MWFDGNELSHHRSCYLLVLGHQAADELDIIHHAVVLSAVGLQVLQAHVQQLLRPLDGVQLRDGQRGGQGHATRRRPARVLTGRIFSLPLE